MFCRRRLLEAYAVFHPVFFVLSEGKYAGPIES